MPTTLPRITVTLSPEVQAVIDEERAAHPEVSTSEAVNQLVLEAARARQALDAQRRTDRSALVRSLAGGVSYPAGYLDDLRNDWT
jgi:Arc/MetJ-type ribon-helix-helix transcriptional regulator